jgi:hexosaminidase
VEDNLAVGATISFKYPPVHIFSLMGAQALVDGSIGTDDWSTTWQGWRNIDIEAVIELKKNISIKYFKMRFMKDIPFDLVTPDEIQLWISANGKDYRQINTIKRPVLNSKTNKEIVDYSVSFKQAINARYMRVIAKCPQANSQENIKTERYLFSDEIYIR